MLGQVEDPTAATLEWSSILLRSFLMEAGLSMVEMDAPYMSYYLETGGGLADAGGGYGARMVEAPQLQSAKLHSNEDDDDDDVQQAALAMAQHQHHQQQQHQQQLQYNSMVSMMMKSKSSNSKNVQVLLGGGGAGNSCCSMIGPGICATGGCGGAGVVLGSNVSSTTAVQDMDLMSTSIMSSIGAGSTSSAATTTSVAQDNSYGGVTSSASTTPWMDPRLWSRLPEKLVERVLACLPLPSFFRSRLVCKRWYNLLFSDSFLEVCAKVRPTRPWFLLFRRGEWSEAFVFDAVGKAWFRIDLSFLPPRFNVVASSGGLLCCISEARGCKTVLICNPLTRACVQLPAALKERFVPTVGLVVDKAAPPGYRVMVAGDDLISPFAVKNLTTEVYDSRSQSWRMTAPLPRLCNLESGKTTYANGFFYCMNYSPFSVLAYDTQQGVWSKIQAPMRRFLRTPNLVECRGRLVLVAAVEKNKLNVPKSIRIWGLQHSRMSWVELERMPQALYDEFMCVSGHKSFHCIGHGNLILITLPDSPDMLLYDFYEKVWRWAPRCPFATTASASDQMPVGGGFHAFAFDPRLEASVY